MAHIFALARRRSERKAPSWLSRSRTAVAISCWVVLAVRTKRRLSFARAYLQGGVEGGDGLADAGGGLEEEVLAVGDGGLDGGEDQLLAGPDLAVGEGEALGRLAALGGALAFGLPGVEEAVEAAADGDLDALEVDVQRLAHGLVAADGDEDQLGADVRRGLVPSAWLSIQA